MADVYGNPYLPSFIRNQPKMTDPVPVMPMQALPTKACQITSVEGFAGARAHAGSLTNGSSEIVAESNQDLARVYVVVVGQNGQQYVQGFDLVPVQEPKAVTMDDLNEKMNKVLERLNQLEEERAMNNDQPGYRASVQGKPATGSGGGASRNAQNGQRPAGNAVQTGGNKPSGETDD